ncbi:MAG: MoaD/ThiS family protein [Terrimicrobiaceae bacterium]
MKVLYFAQASDAAGCREEDWPVEKALPLDDFWAEVIRRHPAMSLIADQCRVASGMSYVESGQCLDAKAETAIIPPVSGG